MNGQLAEQAYERYAAGVGGKGAFACNLTGSVSKSVEIIFAEFNFTTGRVDTDRQGTKDTKKRHISLAVLSAEGQCLRDLRDPHFFSVYSVVKNLLSTEMDTLPFDARISLDAIL